jgi:cytochrome oxidase Cu insertion factor (SCO1/SenC/PrrC family)
MQRLAFFWRAGGATGALVCIGVAALGAIGWARATAGRSDTSWAIAAQGNGLIDQRGEPFAMGQLRGNTVVLNFIFTHCPGICPLQTQALRRVSAALPEPVRERVHFVSVSVDPERDTPSALAAFARQHGVDQERWTFVTGREGELRALGESYAAQALPEGAGPLEHRTEFGSSTPMAS